MTVFFLLLCFLFFSKGLTKLNHQIFMALLAMHEM